MLHTEKTYTKDGGQIIINASKVETFNRMIIEASPDYFFGSNRDLIERYASELKKDL